MKRRGPRESMNPDVALKLAPGVACIIRWVTGMPIFANYVGPHGVDAFEFVATEPRPMGARSIEKGDSLIVPIYRDGAWLYLIVGKRGAGGSLASRRTVSGPPTRRDAGGARHVGDPPSQPLNWGARGTADERREAQDFPRRTRSRHSKTRPSRA